MNKKTFIISIILLIFLLNNLKVYATANSCEKNTEDIEYFTASLFDYNNIEFNESARNMTQSDFNSLSIEEKNNIDKKHTLLGTAGLFWDSWHGKNASMYGGMQNATILKDGKAVPYTPDYNSSIYKGIIKNKLVNNNIVLNYANNNDTELFPEYEKAEAKGKVGNGKVYQEILRNYKIPFIKQKSGYYYMDSNKYHYKKATNKSFELHNGTVGGVSEWNHKVTGFLPFNNDCYDEESTERNNLYFGMRIDINFYMTEDGKAYNSETKQLEDIIFEFTGDDDIWVFVDDNLILDMGGASFQISEGYINFAQNETYTNLVIDENLNITPKVYQNNVFGEKTLTKGEHKLTVFYTERFGGSANFKMRFNLPKKEELTTYSGTKIWRDDNNSQKLRPQNYTLNLYADGKYLKSKTFTTEKWEFDKVLKNDRITNQEIKYTIKEDEIILKNGDKYVPTINGTNVINTLTGTTTIEAQKIWKDNENKNKKRPTNIIFTVKKILGGDKN